MEPGLRRSAWIAVLLVLAVGCNEPAVKITSPLHGSFSTDANVTITGAIANANVSDVRVRVNNVATTLNPDGSFSITLPLDAAKVVNPYLAVMRRISDGKILAKDRIVVHAGTGVADGDFSPQSVALRLNDSGLDQIEPTIHSLVNLDIAALLPVGTTVISGYCAISVFGACVGRIDARVANPPPSISDWSLNVDSQTNYVAGDINVFNMRIDLDLIGSGLAPSCGLRLTANSTAINGNYALQPQASNPIYVDVNMIGAPVVSFQGFHDQFTYGLCNFPLIGSLIQLIIGDVQPIVVNGMQNFLSDPDGAGPLDSPIADAIETALAGISISGTIGQALQTQLDAPLFEVAEDVDGLTLGSDTRVTSSVGTGPGQCNPPKGSPNLAGSYSVPEAFPGFGATSVGGLPYDLGLGISTSAFNQLLKAQVECGLLRAELRAFDLGTGPMPLTAGTLALLIPEFASVDPGTPLVIKLTPTLAPLLTGNSGPGGEIGEIRVGQYLADVEADTVVPIGYLRVAVDFRAGLGMGFDSATHQLAFSIGSIAPADVTVAILGNNINTSEGPLLLGLPTLLSEQLPAIGAGLANFPIPSFFGLQLQGVEVSRNGAFYTLFANLVPGP
jgi:hypothetical protein